MVSIDFAVDKKRLSRVGPSRRLVGASTEFAQFDRNVSFLLIIPHVLVSKCSHAL